MCGAAFRFNFCFILFNVSSSVPPLSLLPLLKLKIAKGRIADVTLEMDPRDKEDATFGSFRLAVRPASAFSDSNHAMPKWSIA